ncbi:MAG: radical SAM protein [Candidatus Saccharicenans sp.]|nr:radical SAM protein [Candidatus Saccharicenans sp.]
MRCWKIASLSGQENVAWIYVLASSFDDDVLIECVDALDPRYSPGEKWVIILSSQKGCPVKCRFCDAAFYYRGNLSHDELKEQLDIILANRAGQLDYLGSAKIKLHFARMGEPAFNEVVLNFLENLTREYPGMNFIPTVATLAPAGCDSWFVRLKEIKDKYFAGGKFQLQFSMNSTDASYRDHMMPVKKWDFQQISDYGEWFFCPGDRKITLNFALAEKAPFEAGKIMSLYNPGKFLIKITPLNPTGSAAKAGLGSALKFDGHLNRSVAEEIDILERNGWEVIISIGTEEEIRVGSNCGQIALRHINESLRTIC